MRVERLISLLRGEDVHSPADVIGALRFRKHPTPDIRDIENQWDPMEHKIYSQVHRPDKLIKKDVNGETTTVVEPVARVALAMQKLIVKRAASFLFGNSVNIHSSKVDLSEQEKVALYAIKRILSDNKEKAHNKKIARTLFKCTEVAEIWYADGREKRDRYGLGSDLKIRCQVFSPLYGDVLYPLMDDTGDLIAFSREYKRTIDDLEYTFFETYTAHEKVKWVTGGESSGWREVKGSRKPNPIGKIPVVYARQDQTEWYDVQNIIERLEKLLSNYADTIDYHASPTIFVKGKVEGFSKKGESGKIIESENDADAKYLSWDQAPDAVKLEIESDLRMIFSLTQTPDISLESVKGIGNVTGIALKLLFLDAHLKVEDKKEVFDEFLTRRYNILKAYVGAMNMKLDAASQSLDLEPEITPYMIADEQSLIDMLYTATGQKQILSQKSAIRILGWVNDIDSELQEIVDENN